MDSSLSRSSSIDQNWKHHVFPSFHGADVRKAFLSHVVKEFRSKGIDLFIDDDIVRGKSIGPELIEAIRGSRIAIVLLSKNYASSTWCLDELVEIMKCREELGQTVMTIFYEVDPTDVKKQIGDFGKVFGKTCESKIEENIGRWKHALAEVAKIAGFHSSNWANEAEMIEKIAIDVSNKLNNSTPSTDFDGLVGMEYHMKKIEPLLGIDSNDVRIIGILGPPGIGKTTIARFLFNRHSENFQQSIFMENIKTRYTIPVCSDDYGVRLYLHKQFMSQIINQMDIKIPHLGIVKERLKDKKVIVVLDDVDRLVQLEAMANETRWFGPWSRIIITTQDQKLLKAHGIDHIYKVDFPSSDEALQMFCMYAFGQKSPKDDFNGLAWEVSRLAGKLPLGLRVMGSYFRGMSMQDWKKALPRLKTRLDGEIESILKLSYDALCDEDKILFLHISCFFEGEQVDIVEEHLANSVLNVTQGIQVLTEKSLIYMDSGRIKMHNLLIQLGREIVRKQSIHEPGKRQFLVDAIDINEVLNDDKADSSNVIGIDLSSSYDNMDIACTSERAFERLSNLQFLRTMGSNTSLKFPRNLNSISRKLRMLHWPNFHMPCLPCNFYPRFLVSLDMPGSNLEKLWEGIQPLSNLKWMNLISSENLKELPDLSTATNLHNLKLYNCKSLVEIPSSIGHATSLQELDLSYCSSLVKLPSSIGNAINLQELDLSYCSSLVELPFSIGNAINLKKLDLSHCSSLVELPFSIGNASNLQKLNLGYCSSLVELPSSIGSVTNLQELDLSHCSNLVELPSSFGNLCRLSKLNLKECSKLEVLLTNINLESLEELDLSDCSLLKSFHETSTHIEDLKISGTKMKEVSHYEIQELNPWIWRISCLRRLALNRIHKQVSLPQLPYSLLELDADSCESLERLDCSFGNPDICLSFIGCFKLNQEARDFIIHTPTNGYTVLPGGKLPECFTYRAFGSFLTVKLNQNPLRTSTRFKACILLDYKADDGFGCYNTTAYEDGENATYCSITYKQNALTSCVSNREIGRKLVTEHLYTFEVEAEEVTSSTELVFEFELCTRFFDKNWEIKECGVLQLRDGD